RLRAGADPGRRAAPGLDRIAGLRRAGRRRRRRPACDVPDLPGQLRRSVLRRADPGPRGNGHAVSRHEAVVSAGVVFVIAIVVRWYAASLVVFPRPEDTAYYVDVARNLLGGRGLVSDALWSYQTAPLVVPRPAFEVWLPLPTFAAALPMAVFGPSFEAAQVSSIVIGALVPVLAWRLAADVAEERRLPPGRARTLAIGTGVTAGVSLPLILHSTLPDSTMPVVALVVFAPWLIRDQLAFGSPLPGQALSNALSIDGTDIFAWQDPPTLGRYLAIGLPRLLDLRITGIGHNLFDVLLLPGAPLSFIGLAGLPWAARLRSLQPLALVSVAMFLVTALVFPVSTTRGTFLHAAG